MKNIKSKKSSNFIKSVKYYSRNKPGAEEFLNKTGNNTWWHPKIGTKLIRFASEPYKFKSKEAAIKKAEKMIKHFKNLLTELK